MICEAVETYIDFMASFVKYFKILRLAQIECYSDHEHSFTSLVCDSRQPRIKYQGY